MGMQCEHTMWKCSSGHVPTPQIQTTWKFIILEWNWKEVYFLCWLSTSWFLTRLSTENVRFPRGMCLDTSVFVHICLNPDVSYGPLTWPSLPSYQTWSRLPVCVENNVEWQTTSTHTHQNILLRKRVNSNKISALQGYPKLQTRFPASFEEFRKAKLGVWAYSVI